MPAVLITRPLVDAARLEARLCAAGYAVLSEPLLTIAPTEDPMPAASNFDAVMMTSANAPARLIQMGCANGAKVLKDLGLWAGQVMDPCLRGDDDGVQGRDYDFKTLLALPCFCVGEHTAAAARQAGFGDVRISAGNGLDLAEAVRAALPPSRSVLHIAGADTASAGRDQLAAWGYAISSWQVYRAVPATVLSPRLSQALREEELGVALFFSPKTAALFASLAAQHQVAACCQSLTAIGLSEAVGAALRPLPWRRIAVAETPTEEAMISCLRHICPAAAHTI